MSGQNESPYYFVPHPSRHPISAAIGLLVMLSSLAAWINGESWAPLTVLAGLLWLLYTLWHWFGDAISESEGGMYGKNVDKSYRWSMSWFIFSEVMFFGAFFGCVAEQRSGSAGVEFQVDATVAGADHQHGAAALVGRDADRGSPCAA
jgi:cytochrome c oxidase subunit 3